MYRVGIFTHADVICEGLGFVLRWLDRDFLLILAFRFFWVLGDLLRIGNGTTALLTPDQKNGHLSTKLSDHNRQPISANISRVAFREGKKKKKNWQILVIQQMLLLRQQDSVYRSLFLFDVQFEFYYAC
ncbi:hypothetical protein VTO42DRAFT_6276 [Malbranchea cinnamomea]